MVSDLGRSFGSINADGLAEVFTLVTEIPGMSENICGEVIEVDGRDVLLDLKEPEELGRFDVWLMWLGVIVNWPLPMLTTVDGEVGIIFSAADEISELMSNMGNFVLVAVGSGGCVYRDTFDGIDTDGLEPDNKEDMLVRLVSL